MNWEETIVAMNSGDYKERFKAEYWQTKIRRNRLKVLLAKIHRREFVPDCPVEMLENQSEVMKHYLGILEMRAEIEGVDLRYSFEIDDDAE